MRRVLSLAFAAFLAVSMFCLLKQAPWWICARMSGGCLGKNSNWTTTATVWHLIVAAMHRAYRSGPDQMQIKRDRMEIKRSKSDIRRDRRGQKQISLYLLDVALLTIITIGPLMRPGIA